MTSSVDVTDADAVTAAVDAAVAKHGPVDVLVNNAGVMQLGKLSTQDPSEWRTMFEVNVLGLLNVTRAVLPSMEERGTGTIVNVSSVAGIKAFPDHAAYCGTKFGVHGISARRSLERTSASASSLRVPSRPSSSRTPRTTRSRTGTSSGRKTSEVPSPLTTLPAPSTTSSASPRTSASANSSLPPPARARKLRSYHQK